MNVSGDPDESIHPRRYRIATTGESETTFEELADDELGMVYRRGDRYYTVVLAEETRVDRPLLTPASRKVVLAAGVFSLFAARLLAPDLRG